MTPVWMVASGKGGVGKTTVATSFGAGLAKRGKSCILVDLDTGLRNADLVFGLESRVVYDLVDVMDGEATLSQALIQHPRYEQLRLLFTAQTQLPRALQPEALEKIIRQLRVMADYVILDCPSGIGHTIGMVLPLATDCILVTTPDDYAMRDADRLAGLMRGQDQLRLHLFVNRTRAKWAKKGIVYTPEAVSQVLDVPLIGSMEESEQVLYNLVSRRPAIEGDGACWQQLTGALDRLLGECEDMPAENTEPRRSWWPFRKRAKSQGL